MIIRRDCDDAYQCLSVWLQTARGSTIYSLCHKL